MAGGLYNKTVYAVSDSYSIPSISQPDTTYPFAANITSISYNSTFITISVKFPANTICDRVKEGAYDSMNEFINSTTPVNCSVTNMVYIIGLVLGSFYDL